MKNFTQTFRIVSMRQINNNLKCVYIPDIVVCFSIGVLYVQIICSVDQECIFSASTNSYRFAMSEYCRF